MKVLHVQNIQGIAGSENYLLALLPQLKARGLDVGFALIYNHGRPGSKKEVDSFRDQLSAFGIPVHYYEIGCYLNLSAPLFLKQVCSQGGYEVVHSHLIYADCWAAMLKMLSPKIRTVSTKHGYQDELLGRFSDKPEKLPRNLYYRLFRFAESRIDASYACSNGLRSFLERGGLVAPGKLSVIEHGFSFPTAPKVKDRFRFGPQQLTIVGRLLPRKGHRFAMEAMHILRHEFPDMQLVCCGDGPLKGELEERAAELGIADRVHFTGFTTEVASYQAATDINLMPSLGEGLPLALMESFNSGKPVVAFDVIGCNDLIEHGQNGLLVQRENTEQLAIAISRLLFSKSRSSALARNALERLNDHFNLNRMCEETLAFYKGGDGEMRQVA